MVRVLLTSGRLRWRWLSVTSPPTTPNLIRTTRTIVAILRRSLPTTIQTGHHNTLTITIPTRVGLRDTRANETKFSGTAMVRAALTMTMLTAAATIRGSTNRVSIANRSGHILRGAPSMLTTALKKVMTTNRAGTNSNYLLMSSEALKVLMGYYFL